MYSCSSFQISKSNFNIFSETKGRRKFDTSMWPPSPRRVFLQPPPFRLSNRIISYPSPIRRKKRIAARKGWFLSISICVGSFLVVFDVGHHSEDAIEPFCCMLTP